MEMADGVTLGALGVDGGSDCAVSRTPGNDEQFAFLVSDGGKIGNVLRDGGHFGGANVNHIFVIERLVIDVAGAVLFFEAADAVFETGISGDSPGTRESFRIAFVRSEAFGIGGEAIENRRNRGFVRN